MVIALIRSAGCLKCCDTLYLMEKSVSSGCKFKRNVSVEDAFTSNEVGDVGGPISSAADSTILMSGMDVASPNPTVSCPNATFNILRHLSAERSDGLFIQRSHPVRSLGKSYPSNPNQTDLDIYISRHILVPKQMIISLGASYI
jgi:hypothetical protein